MNLRVFYLTRRGISDGYTHSNLGRHLLKSWESQFSHRATLTKM